MTEFIKSKTGSISLTLNSFEKERASLFATTGALLSSLAFVFSLLTLIRIGILVSDFGLQPIMDFRMPLMIAWTAFLFLLSFALAAPLSLVSTLIFSSSLGMSVPGRTVVAAFHGLTAFILVMAWQSQVPWFFGGYITNPTASVTVVSFAMVCVSIWPQSHCVSRTENKHLQIKHLLTGTTVIALFLAQAQLWLESDTAVLVLRHVLSYIVLQVIVLGVAWRWIARR